MRRTRSGGVDAIRDYFAEARWRPSPGRTYLLEERQSLLRRVFRDLNRAAEAVKICDLGCGGGADLLMWRDVGVSEDGLAGTELVEERVVTARAALPEADLRMVDGFDLPFGDGTFDLCSASLVLSTIQGSSERQHLVQEMQRVTAPGGVVVIYDFIVRKPWNRNVVALSTQRLTDAWRRPDRTYPAAPFLPFLDAALRAPSGIGTRLLRGLPRTHRMWIWVQPDAVPVTKT